MTETETDVYAVRTRRNIAEADGTAIFSRCVALSGGTLQTAEIAEELGKPLLKLIESREVKKAARRLQQFILRRKIAVLNIAGPRESQAANLGVFVKAVLTEALTPAWRKTNCRWP